MSFWSRDKSHRVMDGVPEFYAEMTAIAERHGVPLDLLPSRDRHGVEDGLWITRRPDGGFVEWYQERGRASVVHEGAREDVMFELFSSATGQMGGHVELRYRVPGLDTRRMWFAIQATLMAGMDPAWGERERARQAAILDDYGFRDDAA